MASSFELSFTCNVFVFPNARAQRRRLDWVCFVIRLISQASTHLASFHHAPQPWVRSVKSRYRAPRHRIFNSNARAQRRPLIWVCFVIRLISQASTRFGFVSPTAFAWVRSAKSPYPTRIAARRVPGHLARKAYQQGSLPYLGATEGDKPVPPELPI